MQVMVIPQDQPLPEWPEHLALAGVDEAGRGPLAGPVVAAAVILPARFHLPGLNDSKRLDTNGRERLEPLIQQQAVAWSVAEVTAAEIDRINIFQATLQAMHRALSQLNLPPACIAVDGRHCPPWPGPRYAVIRGDARLAAISAASILAKVHRDRLMVELDRAHPEYGFARHKGYPTREHLQALREYGPCPAHRRSYRPVREAENAS